MNLVTITIFVLILLSFIMIARVHRKIKDIYKIVSSFNKELKELLYLVESLQKSQDKTKTAIAILNNCITIISSISQTDLFSRASEKYKQQLKEKENDYIHNLINSEK
jgi:biopolymer transport protein ExbB/TolQ